MNNMSVIFDQFGPPQQVLQVKQQPLARLEKDEILVRMLACPINPSDLIPVTGAYAHRISLPSIPGYEGVGVVEAVGAKVNCAWLGKRVLPLRGEGTWQQYVKSPFELAVPVPEWMDNFTAAQLYINPVTAWVVLSNELNLKTGDYLLMNAASSSIGRIIAQMCRLLGYQFIAITSSIDLKEELLALGAAHVLDASFDKRDLQTTVMELTSGRGADSAIDCIGGMSGNRLAACLKKGGTFLSIGLLSGKSVDWTYIHNDLHLQAKLFHLRHWNHTCTAYQWHATFSTIIHLLQKKQLVIQEPSANFALQHVKSAIAFHESQTERMGKVMLTLPADILMK